MRAHPISVRHNSGEQVANILNPVRGLRDQQRRSGRQPVDHARRNLMQLKDTQRRIQDEREKMAQVKQPEPFKMKKFKQVESKLRLGGEEQNREEEDDSRKAQVKKHTNFLRKGERCNTNKTKIQAPTTRQQHQEELNTARTGSSESSRSKRVQVKQSVPKATELNTLAPRTHKNFIANNAREVVEKDIQNQARRVQVEQKIKQQEAAKHKDFGQVPKYLLKMQSEQLRQEAERAARLNNECPPGMKLLSELDRVKTLDSLNENMKAVQNELRKFPLTITSMAQRQRKEEVEGRLKELESAIEIFSRDKVYIAE